MTEHLGGFQRVPPRFPRRFSLIFLLALVTALCIFLAWWVQPRRYVVETIFHLSATKPNVLDPAGPTFDPREFDLIRRTHRELIRSESVITSALRDPKIASLRIIKSQQDAVAWVRERLEVQTWPDTELLVIRMRCTENAADEYQQLVDAIAEAYIREVVFEDEQRRLMARDSFDRKVNELRSKLEQNMKAFNRATDDDAAKRAAAKIEIDAQTELLTELIRRRTLAAFNGSLVDRVRQVQAATIRPE
jgi:hypothetical protein